MSERHCPVSATFLTRGGNLEADSDLVAMRVGTPTVVNLNDDGTNDFTVSCGLIQLEGRSDLRECALVVLARLRVFSPEVTGQCLQSQTEES